ncbi:rubredoxin [Galbibacter sp. PAP.153]|uniref:rubredoxin n=1 Tax=Galbibacter sp. PAP.153 TaxID=3104623 RepID=UPI003009B24B
MRKELYRLIIKGGVLSPGELKNIVTCAENSGLKSISFGSRQDILFNKEIKREQLDNFNDLEWIAPNAKGTENIMCSYISADIFPNTSWLTGDRYLYILEQFRHQPLLKINIADPKQRLVPLYTGHLNFIASPHEDYWYLYLRLPQWEKTTMYPVLIYSWDIAKVSVAIEALLQEEPENVSTVFELVNDAVDANNRNIDTPLHVPFHPFPYYEGMNRMGTDKYWLGLYWRNNKYDLDFLKSMCDLCAECKIGKIGITPWKSFIIKGIQTEFKLKWEKFLGKRGINVRHSMLELNWHLPVANKEALKLKRYLVSNFDQNDISTYGLTFGITDYTRKAYYFTSIVIEKNKQPEISVDFKIRDTYNLLYAKNFDPNTMEYLIHVQDVDKVELPGLLIELSKMYFDVLGEGQDTPNKKTEKKDTIETEVYQCRECLTIYDPEYGDITQNIDRQTPFNELPETYCCSLCEAHKSAFAKKVLVKELE